MTRVYRLTLLPLLALQCCLPPAVLCSPLPRPREMPQDASGALVVGAGSDAQPASGRAASRPFWEHPLAWGAALFGAGYGARAILHDGKHGGALRRMQTQLDRQQSLQLQLQSDRARIRLIELMLADVYLHDCVLFTKFEINKATPKTATANGCDINNRVVECAAMTQSSIAGYEPFPDVSIPLWDLVPPQSKVMEADYKTASLFPPPPLPNRDEKPSSPDTSTSAMSMQDTWRYVKQAAVSAYQMNRRPRVRQGQGSMLSVIGARGSGFAFGRRGRF